MASTQKPTFVFIPGAWHRVETWDKVIALTGEKGYKNIAITLPSTRGDPSATFGDDVKEVQRVISDETCQGRNVVLAAHSYGGFVGNSAVKGFARSPEEPANGKGHVIGLALMASGFTVTGMAFLEMVGGKPPPSWVMNEETGFADIVADAKDMMYHDLPEDEGDLWVSKLTKHSLLSLTSGGEYAYAGWKDVPSFYLVTLDDHTHPEAVQEFIVNYAQKENADVTKRTIMTSHSPMLSKPQETANFLIEAAESFVRKSDA